MATFDYRKWYSTNHHVTKTDIFEIQKIVKNKMETRHVFFNQHEILFKLYIQKSKELCSMFVAFVIIISNERIYS